MAIKVSGKQVDPSIDGDEAAIRILITELQKRHVPDPELAAREIHRKLRAGPPELVTLQEGNLQQHLDRLEAVIAMLRAENAELKGED